MRIPPGKNWTSKCVRCQHVQFPQGTDTVLHKLLSMKCAVSSDFSSCKNARSFLDSCGVTAEQYQAVDEHAFTPERREYCSVTNALEDLL